MATEISELIKKAVNKTLINCKKAGLKKDGSPKKGYVVLPDGRVVLEKAMEEDTE